MPGLLPYLRLLRAGTLFSPGCDVVAGFCILGAPWSAEAFGAVAASICLYAAGMVWNDVADRRTDAVLRPERPLPRGDVPLPAAVALGAALIAGGLLLSPPDYRLHHAMLAALVLAYDFAAKRIALLGALTMGLLRGLNLMTAAAPLWLSVWPAEAAPAGSAPAAVPPDLLAAAGCYAVYVIAVTVLGIFEDVPRVRARAVVAVQTAPLIAGPVGILAVQDALWPAPALSLLPVLAFARRNRAVAVWDQRAIRRSMLFLLLGTMLYTALLCAAAGRWWEAAGIAACIPLARRVARRISLT